MLKDLRQGAEIRRRLLVDGVSKRQLLRATGRPWRTREKILRHSPPPGFPTQDPRPQPKLGPFLDRIPLILAEDKHAPRKQRHTAQRSVERLGEAGDAGGSSVVRAAVRQARRRGREVFVPLAHPPGEAQGDFGEAVAQLSGQLRKVAFFVRTLPHWEALFVRASDREGTETFWDGQARAFDFFGGVPRRITSPNRRVRGARIVGPRPPELTEGFLPRESPSLVDHFFCRVERPHEQGVVEGTVKCARLNFLVPVPQVRDRDELNAGLLTRCRDDLGRRVRGERATQPARLEEDRGAFWPRPAAPCVSGRTRATAANALSLVRSHDNDSSVPVRSAHHPSVGRAEADRIVLGPGGRAVAEPRRGWGREGVSDDPVPSRALRERTPGVFDQARPRGGGELPACFARRRARREAERDGDGTRAFLRLLRRREKPPLDRRAAAVAAGVRARTPSREAVAPFLRPRADWRATPFSLDGRAHLRHVVVATTEGAASRGLLTEGGTPGPRRCRRCCWSPP